MIAVVIADFEAKPVIHGGADSCLPCHQKEVDGAKKGKHATNACEGCHGPVTAHVKDNAKFANATVDKSMDLCTRCHEKLQARPKEFPQIVPGEHLVKVGAISAGEAIPKDACLTCHDAHSPGIATP